MTHIDSTLEYLISWDHIDYYEKNWGKNYSFVLAFSDANVEDVTMYYSKKSYNVHQTRFKQKMNNNINSFKRFYLNI